MSTQTALPAPRVVEVIDTAPDTSWAQRVRLRPEPRQPIGAQQVRIGMLAMTVLPADLLQMQQRYGVQPSVPYVPGHEGVALVLEAGAEVGDLQVGQRVMPLGAGGLWADERVVHRRSLLPLPAEGDALQQAMLAANPATAWVLLKHMGWAPGQWVLQNAANSAVGQCVRQLAGHLGIPLINIVRRSQAIPEGAQGHWLVDDGLDADALRQQVVRITGAQPVMLALDALGGTATQSLAACLSEAGRVIVYGLLSGQASQIGAHDLVFRGIEVRGFWLARWFGEAANRQAGREVYPALLELVRQDVLHMEVEQVYDLGDVAQALAHAALPHRRGKVLLRGIHGLAPASSGTT